MIETVKASDLAFLSAPLLAGLGLPALLTPRKYVQCGGRSALQPPGWVFGVAWTTLYALYGVAMALAWRRAGRRWTQGLTVAAITLALLVAWSLVFFNLCAPAAAFAAILGLLGLSAGTTAAFAHDGATTSAWLTAPLTAWLSFASYLAFCTMQ